MDIDQLKAFKPWQYEFFYAKNPGKFDSSFSTQSSEVLEALSKTDFTTEEALGFEKGWGAAIDFALQHLDSTVSELKNA